MYAEEFKEIFNPFCSKYSKQIEEEGLFEVTSKWIVINRYLSNEIIERGLTGIENIGYFKTSWVNSFGLDIDDHENGGWDGVHPNPYLQDKYSKIVERIGFKPSLCIETPHGIHCYYFFTSHTSWIRMYETVSERLGELNNIVEILPTPSKPLRIPPFGCYIDPVKFHVIDPPSKEDIVHYPAKSLFVKPDKVKTEIKSKILEYLDNEFYAIKNLRFLFT